MKKFFMSLLSAAFLVIFVVGCNKQNETQVAPNPVQEKEPSSVIDLMEREEGVKFFKKDVWLKSKDGRFFMILLDATNSRMKIE